MGYRSDVAYVIKFKDIAQRDAFVGLMLAKNDADITQAVEETEHEWTDDPIITFRQNDVKWYESFPDVKAHHTLIDEAVELYEAIYRFIALGEDGQEDYRADDDNSDLYDYVTTKHELHTSF
jgi:hypothetical protein